MANLRDDDRGQIILVAAFAIAVIFVSLALIVNSAIFTENLASRGETAGSDGALSMRAMVETNVGDSLEAINRRPISGHSNLEDELEEDIEEISLQTSRQQSRSGRLVSVSGPSSRDDGTRIFEDDPGDTLENSGTDDYVVVEAVSRSSQGNGTRAFEINASVIRDTGGADAGAIDNASAFEIMANETGSDGNEDSWRARIWETGSGDIHVRTIRNAGGSVETEDCEVSPDSTDPNIYIDVTGGTIDGEPCSALQTTTSGENFHFASGTGVGTSGTYNISFSNADNIQGNFSMTVHGSSFPLIASGLDNEDALYEVTVRYTYATSDLRYETDIRVAPGEPDV
jgi:hypothetical protein